MSDKILKLSQAQTLYEDLRERIDALPTNEDIPAVPVQDVQVNGTSILSQGVANVPVADINNPGVVCINSAGGIDINTSTNRLRVSKSPNNTVKAGTDDYRPIVPSNQHYATFYGLCKAAGADMASVAGGTVGVYPEAQKAAIQNMLGITDLLSTEESSTATAAHAINSTFMMGGKLHRATAAIAIGDAVVVGTNCEVVKADEVFIKNTDYATSSTGGIAKVHQQYGIKMGTDGTTGFLLINPASSTNIKSATSNTNETVYRPITPYKQHEAVFYGLSKVAGVDLANETVTIGTYPETSKTAIRNMLGAVGDVQVNGTSVISNGIADIPYATTSQLGLVKPDGVSINVITGQTGALATFNGRISVRCAEDAETKAGNSAILPISAYRQHMSVFYGLSKVAGVDLASETVTVGTYPATASAAIRSMLGAVGDVQVNGTSVVSNGVATVPVSSADDYGVAKTSYQYGTRSFEGTIAIYKAPSEFIKGGAQSYVPIVPANQHEAVFYGLTKAAGVDMASSSNAIGTYTAEAKAAIHTMLGIDPASIAAQVDIPLVETVSGTTPTITGQPNVRYVCGEVTTIIITPPASGSVDIIFESGSTATTMTVPSTVKWPAWFDAEALEANTTYEVLITDGVYGSVMTWAT